MILKRMLSAAVLAAVIVVSWGSAAQASYPERTVTFLVPFSAGGGTDAIARLMAQRLSDRFGRSFVVENRVGAGGSVAASAVAKSSADGHTLLMATSGVLSTNVSLYKNLPYDPARDFVPVSLLCAVPFVLVVNPSIPVQTIEDLTKLARERQGKMTYASGGVGTFHHMMGELLKSATGIELVHVPYKGGAPAINDVVAGHVPLMFAELPAVRSLIEAGKLRALGITTAERAPAAPDIRPLAESGLSEFDAAAWQMVAVPAKTPIHVLDTLNKELNALVADPQVRAAIVKLGFTPIGEGTLRELHAYVAAETERWKLLIQKAGITVNP